MEAAIIIGILVVLNGLFVAAEFAIIGAPKMAVEAAAGRGDRVAARLLKLIRSPQQQDRFIATAQLGITLASLGLGMYGEHVLAGWIEVRLVVVEASWRWLPSHALASVLAVTALTYLHIVFGEMVPKSLALQHAEATARFVLTPMRILQTALYPFIVSLNGIGNFLLSLAGVRRREAPETHLSPEELQLIVDESEQVGVIRADAAGLLRELFEFGDLDAAEAMVPRVRVSGIPLGASAPEVGRIVRDTRHTRYPVYEGDLDHIVGMLHVKDLLRLLIAGETVAARDVRQLPSVPETMALDDVLAIMQRQRTHMAVVLDEHGGTAGVITLEDLFEEVVGEIDEGKPSKPPLEAVGPDVLLARGTVRLDEVGQMWDLDLEHEDVDSVSGLVLARLGRTPVTGDIVEWNRLRVEVVETRGKGVGQARITLLPPSETDE
ncbi:MAG: HlyC/CorC family transporter [Acidobacteria bacterium]|nr:HlyC/CorC family transporter [Acidobacteriota bacterium]